MNKWRNKGLWISLGSLVTLLMTNYGLFEVIKMDSETFQAAFKILLTILTAAGVISNPTEGTGYIDTTK